MIRALGLLALALLSACSLSDDTVLKPASFADLPGWQQDHQSEPFKLFVDSCAANQKRPNAWRTSLGDLVGDPVAWTLACDNASRLILPTDDEARRFFETNFTPVRVMTDRYPQGRVTGYYEPIIHGATKRHGPYQTPVYGMPPEEAARFCRADIDGGALEGRAPVLLYVDDPVMLFFLHIQGSGKVRMEDGSLLGLQYAGKNGFDYVPIGHILKDMGELQELSLQTIRGWMHDHPDKAQWLMEQNPSYVYFKLAPGDEFAKGALGLPLTPLRSIAVDDERAAYGVPTYIATTRPNYPLGYDEPLHRLFVAQDTGGALHGPHRADIFFGRGKEEEWSAGHQNSLAMTYWLLPVEPAPSIIPGL